MQRTYTVAEQPDKYGSFAVYAGADRRVGSAATREQAIVVAVALAAEYGGRVAL